MSSVAPPLPLTVPGDIWGGANNAYLRWLTDQLVVSGALTVVNARAQGVTGDGTPEDSARFQAFLNAAAGKIAYYDIDCTLGTQVIPAKTCLAGNGTAVLRPRDGLNTDFLTNAQGASDITICDVVLDGRKSTMTSAGTATAVNQNRGIYLRDCARLLITRFHVYDVEGHGIHLSNTDPACEGQRVSDGVIERCGSAPGNTYGSNFATSSAYDLTLSNVHSLDSLKAGFRLDGKFISLNGCHALRNGNGGLVTVSGGATGVTINGGFYCDNGSNTALGATVYGNADGIRLVGSQNVVITGATCSGNGGAGIGIFNSSAHITINGGHRRNNGRAGGTVAAGTVEGRDGITIYGNTTAASDILVTGGQCWDDQATETQQYGVRIRGLADYIVITGNNLRDNLLGAYSNEATTGTTIVQVGNILDDSNPQPQPQPQPTGTYLRTVNVATKTQLDAALADLKYGDDIVLAAGTYTYTADVVITTPPRGAYTASNPPPPTRIRGPRTAVIQRTGTSSGYALHLDNANFLILDGFTIRGGQKSIIGDECNDCTLMNLDSGLSGMELLHLRNFSNRNIVQNCLIHHSDVDGGDGGTGEGCYIGQSESNWGASFSRTNGAPDICNDNQLIGNTIQACLSECFDIKEGTSRTIVRGNICDGSRISGLNSADSYMDIKGNDTLVENNVCTNPSSNVLDGLQTHILYAGYGNRTIFKNNSMVVNNANGLGINVQLSGSRGTATGNKVGTSNTQTGAGLGLTNIPTTAGI